MNGDLPSQEPSLTDSTSQDVLSIASSHGSGSTPPREFVVSAFEPNNCGAEFTVSSQSSYEELRGKVSAVRNLYYNGFRFLCSNYVTDIFNLILFITIDFI